jgi:hypothetical protein
VPELYDRYPPEVRSVGAANPFRVRNTLPYDSKLGTRRWDALNDLFGAVIVDAHPELTAAWWAVLHAGRHDLEDELFAPPCTLDELTDHARRLAEEGPRARTVTVNRWGEEARERYRRVAREARR